MTHYNEASTLRLKELAAEFVALESNRSSLITVTEAHLSTLGEHVTFLVSVFPESAEGAALGFLMRKRGECRTYLKSHAAMKRIPHVEFALDLGEKNRTAIDVLLKS